MNVISEVVNLNRCIGCGVCAGLCPAGALKMCFGEDANYRPFENGNCRQKCKFCLDICPFYRKDLFEDTINSQEFALLPKEQREFGKFLNTYEFYKLDEGERLSSASGGAGHFIFKELFQKDLIDFAICSTSCDFELFRFSVIRNMDELESTKTSAYYPLHLEEMIKFIINNEGRFAVSALPCFAKALRLAMSKNKKIDKRIRFIIGLVCGQGKTANFARKVADLAFNRKNVQLKRVNFREKDKSRTAFQYNFKFTDNFDNIILENWIFNPIKYFVSRAFTPFACNNCADVFAKCADVVLMDAWLQDRACDFRGTSLVITRNETIDKFFEKSNEFCKLFSSDLVYQSQLEVIELKRDLFFGTKNPIRKSILSAKLKVQKYSIENYNCEIYVKRMMWKIKILSKVQSLLRRILHILSK